MTPRFMRLRHFYCVHQHLHSFRLNLLQIPMFSASWKFMDLHGYYGVSFGKPRQIPVHFIFPCTWDHVMQSPIYFKKKYSVI